MGMVVKLILAGFWLVLVPAAAGIPFTGKKQSGFSETFLNGYLVRFYCNGNPYFAYDSYENASPCADCCLGRHWNSTGRFWTFCVWKKESFFSVCLEEKKRPSFYFCIAILLILLQIAVCSLMAHMDADDCFYVATATTDVYTDTIFEVDPYTGTAYRVLPRRYVLSPFPVFLAVVSQLSGRLHPAVMAHMVFPAVFLSMAYMVQAVLAKKWFPGEKKAQGIYLLLAACICSFSRLFCLQCGKLSDGSYLAGKAVLASVLLPYLLCLCISFFLRKKAGDILGSTGACQYKLLPSVLLWE